MKVLVTGSAGFIGFHLSKRLCDMGAEVVGLDNYTPYYSVKLKRRRTAILEQCSGFESVEFDLENASAMSELFAQKDFTHVVHLAAQAGVRYSLEQPRSYVESNLLGFFNVMDEARKTGVQHFVFASSSSVYGLNTRMPFSPGHNVDHPVSLYAATKKSNELMAHAYAHLHGMPCTGLRFFTVYGPWGRPDMALFLFTKAIIEDRPIKVFNHGHMRRDFTYIDDIVEGLVRVLKAPPQGNPDWDSDRPDPSSSRAPYRVFNIGANNSVELGRFIEAVEKAVGKPAIKDFLPMQPGDVPASWADVADLEKAVGYAPTMGVEQGVENFVRWYREYFNV